MDRFYQYPVFFECSSFSEGKQRRIERYFRVRRRSGGGDCGTLRKVEPNFYSIAFKEQEDQQRVLQRSEHVLDFEDGPLVFTVRESLEPPSTSTPVHSPAAQSHVSASGAPPSGAEYELQLDTCLLRHLKECPSARKDLDKDLASVGCSAQFYPEEGRVLVRSLGQAGVADGHGARRREDEVNRLFERIKERHREADPHIAKALLRPSSSDQTAGEVQVDKRDGMAVVVGEQPRVDAGLRDVEESRCEGQASRVEEEETRVCQLPEAKRRLLWEEIKRSLGQVLPGVKVMQGDAGQVILEGSVAETRQAEDLISAKENLVLERTVSCMSPHLLAFLRKEYEGLGLLGNFVSASDTVETEFGDAELHLFSFSRDKLDEAEKELQDEFRDVKIDVSDCSALAAELKLKLESKAQEMNQGLSRAMALFDSGSTVHLFGHTEEVEELNEMVKTFILDQAYTETTVLLPFAEIAEQLPELLRQHGCDHSGVYFRPVSAMSRPMVSLTGPSSRVTQVRHSLEACLDSLSQGAITANLPKARGDSNSPARRKTVPAVGKQNNASGAAPSGEIVATYHLPGGLQVLVCRGDITKQCADALLSFANEDLDHCEGVAAALSHAGGPEVQKESSVLVRHVGKIPQGEVVVTSGGNLNCKRLFHAVGPAGGQTGDDERIVFENAVRASLNLAKMMEFQSIAIPCDSAGVFGLNVVACAEGIVTAVQTFGSQGWQSLRRVILVNNRGKAVKGIKEVCDRVLQGPGAGDGSTKELEVHTGAGAGTSGHGVQVEILQGTIESQQVDALVSPMFGPSPLSSRVGEAVHVRFGPQLISRFEQEAGGAVVPGEPILVENLGGHPPTAVFFLSLLLWDNNQRGTAVQILRRGVAKILATCDDRGFGSVALPVLGTGIVLNFPHAVTARVLREEIRAFEQKRTRRTPFRAHIIIHPNDKKSIKELQSVQTSLEPKRLTRDAPLDLVPTTRRIVLLGKTGSGKSSLANTIFGDGVFEANHSANSGTKRCQAETKHISGRKITLIDTPGFFDPDRSEEELKPEIVRCLAECAPGPHAFLIVLKLEKFTELEKTVVTEICRCFSEDALRHAAVVFTHGEQLPKGATIEAFVRQNKNLSDLVRKCGGRCHVLDNKYWNGIQQDDDRSNRLQVAALLNSVDEMVKENDGRCYTNEALQLVQKEIRQEEERIKQASPSMSAGEIERRAKARVSQKNLNKVVGMTVGALLGILFGLKAALGFAVSAKQHCSTFSKALQVREVGVAAGVVLGVSTGALAITGGVLGAAAGQEAAEEAETVAEAAEKAARAVIEKSKKF